MSKLLVALGLTAAAIAGPALANDGILTVGERASVKVNYADLDLGTAAGRAALDRRLWKAASSVCRAEQAAEPRQLLDARKCREVALSNTKQDVELAVSMHQRQALASRK